MYHQWRDAAPVVPAIEADPALSGKPVVAVTQDIQDGEMP